MRSWTVFKLQSSHDFVTDRQTTIAKTSPETKLSLQTQKLVFTTRPYTWPAYLCMRSPIIGLNVTRGTWTRQHHSCRVKYSTWNRCTCNDKMLSANWQVGDTCTCQSSYITWAVKSHYYPVCVDVQADLRLCCSHMTKTGFLMMWPINSLWKT